MVDCQPNSKAMSQEAFYYQVQMQEEYEMSKIKEFAQQVREEFMSSEDLYCCYCGEHQNGASCCGESDFVPFADLYEDMQDEIVQEELYKYEEATK
jgi:hypothetical protein